MIYVESKSLKFCSAIPAIPTSEAYGDLNGPMPQLVDANKQGVDARQLTSSEQKSWRAEISSTNGQEVPGSRFRELPKCEKMDPLSRRIRGVPTQ